jgi:RNA polymerase sigma factor (sigma-70 family)
MMNDAPVVHIVDDDVSFRAAIARLLRACGYQVALFESGEQLLENHPVAAPGCILLDLKMSGLSGLDLQDRLAQLRHTLPIVFLTGHGDIPATVRAIKAGAEDFLPKPVSRELLLAAVERALERDRESRKDRERLEALRSLVATLTVRENEVFALVVRGRLNKQIAHELGTSERTVKAHRHSIMQKLRVQSLAQLVQFAAGLGLVAAPSGEDK